MVSARPASIRQALAAAAVIAISHLALGALAYRAVEAELVGREAAVAREFFESIVRAESIGAGAFGGASPPLQLKSFASHIEQLGGMARVTIYSRDGFIRHSTEANLVGVKFHDNDELERALAGELIVAFEEETGKPEQLGLSRSPGDPLLEVYIPVRDADGAVISVVEFYKRPAELLEALARLRNRLTAFIAMSAAALSAVFLAWRLRAG